MTQKEFDDLPLLLMPGQVMAVLNCDKETLQLLRESNGDLAVMLQGMKHYRYRKQAVAKLVGLEFK